MTFWSRCSRLMVFGLLAAIASIADAAAAEIKIMTPRSMWTVLQEIGPEFERASRHKLNVQHDIAANLADRIIKGESFDVFVGPPVQIERLIKNNKVIAGTRTPIAHSGIGVEVRAGAPKPDISTVDAFKRALLNAKSIGYLKQEGTSGAYLHGLFERLGIADAIKSKVGPSGNGYRLRTRRQGRDRARNGRHYANYDDARRRACRADTKGSAVLCQMERQA